MLDREIPTQQNKFREEKAAERQKATNVLEASKSANPYAKAVGLKYFRCNQPGHQPHEYSRRKTLLLAEREKKENMKYANQLFSETTMRNLKTSMMRDETTLFEN